MNELIFVVMNEYCNLIKVIESISLGKVRTDLIKCGVLSTLVLNWLAYTGYLLIALRLEDLVWINTEHISTFFTESVWQTLFVLDSELKYMVCK